MHESAKIGTYRLIKLAEASEVIFISLCFVSGAFFPSLGM